MIVLTVGHSTRPIDAFIGLLSGHGVSMLADIRRYPASRRCPWFDRDALQEHLAEAGMGYTHVAELGGRRSRPDGIEPSVNAGWTSPSFHHYADYTLTPAYARGVARLLEIGREGLVALMCSEALPWRCHRLLVSNTLVARGERVRHLLSATTTAEHELGRWGAPPRRAGEVLTYPREPG